MKSLIKKIIPKSFLGQYHKSLAILADIFYGRPSGRMIVIGVTGTNGKSTTTLLVAKILEEAGFKVGATSTAMFKVADREWLNNKKMTMLGRFALEKLLQDMVRADCRYAVVETSSEGIKQYRHRGINYDVAIFTNLTPEHIESHGSFANYKKAKLELFARLAKLKKKKLADQMISKTIIANIDDEHGTDFLSFPVDRKIAFGIANQQAEIKAENISFSESGVSFDCGGERFELKLFGKFNVYNCLAAIAAAQSQGIGLDVCRQALQKVVSVPGRMEFVEAGQDFKVLVDYAPEPESMRQLYQTIRDHKMAASGKIIHLLGSCGGGRDKSRRPVLGRLAAEYADIVIVTNEDPYDDDPAEIIDQVAAGAMAAGKILDKNLFKVLDRREAIERAVELAREGDLVLLTGKGCEQAICVADGKKISWDEREEVKKAIKNREMR